MNEYRDIPDVALESDRFERNETASAGGDRRRHGESTSFARDAAAEEYLPRRKVKNDQIVFFATQMAVMIDTGVPIDEALDSIAEQSEHPGLKRVVRDIAARVKGGAELSTALQAHPEVFDNLFVALMKAAEASGRMGAMLLRVSEYLESQQETRKRVKGALVYPICMLAFCVLVVTCLMIFVLPRFEKIYAGKGAVLPTPTRVLLGTSGFLVAYWPYLLAGLAAAGVGSWLYFRSPGGRIVLDRIRLKVPLIGTMYRKAFLSRSLRTMATMVSSGVDIVEGLKITARSAGSYSYEQLWLEVLEEVKEGSSITDALLPQPLMPRAVSQMISAGERSGRLAEVMDRVAGYTETELKVAVKAITSMIEPVMIIVMGLVVGGIAMALLLPVFSVSKVVGH
jgi:type IV pilus assembly protein PilC